MAVYQTYAAKGNREDLANIIDNVSPEETPLYSSLEMTKATATFHEWQTDKLRAATKDNAAVEGADATTPDRSPTYRLGNYTQIVQDSFSISGTQEGVDKAGRKSEIQYQLVKTGKELKTDIEASICQNNAAVAGNNSTARKSAGLETFAWEIKNHSTAGTPGSTTVVTAGAPTTAPVDGSTPRAFTEAVLKDVLQQGFAVGSRFKQLYVGGAQKGVVGSFAGLGQTRLSVSQSKKSQGVIVGAADVYISDFGDISIIPSPHMRNRTALFVDPDKIRIAKLRDWSTEKLAKTGDAEKRQMLCEFTLEVKNPRGVGKAADLS